MVKDTLMSGEELTAGGMIVSKNGRYTFVYQADGNLVLYDGTEFVPGKALWASGTMESTLGKLRMQEDGNLVLYDRSNKAIWASKTSGQHNHLIVQDDGNLVIYSETPVWHTNTWTR